MQVCLQGRKGPLHLTFMLIKFLSLAFAITYFANSLAGCASVSI